MCKEIEKQMSDKCKKLWGNGINALWNDGTKEDWETCLAGYWLCVKPENYLIEKYFECQFNAEMVKQMLPSEFYQFLRDSYFHWKFTAKHHLATTRQQLERYNTENKLADLAKVKDELFSFDKVIIYDGLSIAKKIHGLATIGASGLLAVLFPEYFCTVDMFVVERLQEIKDLPQHDRLLKMHKGNLELRDGIFLINIMRDKAKKIGLRPRDIDKVLWCFGRKFKTQH